MKTSVTWFNKIATFEGLSLKAYKGADGIWTIGHGHTGNVQPNQRITYEEAGRLLSLDIKQAETVVSKIPNLTQGQFDALVSFVYNVGGTRFHSSTLYKKVVANRSDKTIGYEFCRWIYCNGKILTGLVKRREEEAKRYYE